MVESLHGALDGARRGGRARGRQLALDRVRQDVLAPKLLGQDRLLVVAPEIAHADLVRVADPVVCSRAVQRAGGAPLYELRGAGGDHRERRQAVVQRRRDLRERRRTSHAAAARLELPVRLVLRLRRELREVLAFHAVRRALLKQLVERRVVRRELVGRIVQRGAPDDLAPGGIQAGRERDRVGHRVRRAGKAPLAQPDRGLRHAVDLRDNAPDVGRVRVVDRDVVVARGRDGR